MHLTLFNKVIIIELELNKIDIKENDDTDIKIECYNEANKERRQEYVKDNREI